MVGTDDIFNQLGPWHYPLLAFCFLRGFPAAYHAMAPTFTAPQLNHWCAKPSQLANWSTERWLENAVPWEERKGSQKRSQCEMYVYEEGADGSITFFNNSRVKCLAWEYDLGDKTYTLTDTFDLVCDRVWLRTASQSIYMAGIMIGNTVFSHLSDWYGRRQSLLLSMPLPIMAGLLTTFARTFWLYNIGRLIASIGVGGIQNATLTIAMEVLSTRHRAIGMLVASGEWTTGLVTLTGIGWLIRDWQHMQIVISLSYLVNFFLFIPESPLWLLATKHYKKAESILKKATTKNNVGSVDVNQIIKSYEDKMESGRTLKKPTFAALFRYRCLRRTSIILSFKSIFSTLLYYDLTYTSILLGTNPYLSFFLMACMEYPQKFIAIFFINSMKRRTAYVFLYASAALCSLAIIFIPSAAIYADHEGLYLVSWFRESCPDIRNVPNPGEDAGFRMVSDHESSGRHCGTIYERVGGPLAVFHARKRGAHVIVGRAVAEIDYDRNRPQSPRVCFRHFEKADFMRRRQKLLGLRKDAIHLKVELRDDELRIKQEKY
ncbi:hypothetical protein MRX96_001087 [Rhipicephalus microplus]